MIDEVRRAEEQGKYAKAYRLDSYRMGPGRRADAINDLDALPCRGAYLDVGCGRGEMLQYAARMGFCPTHGVEVVPELIDRVKVDYGEVHALPFVDNTFEVVSLFDVIEHLLPGDDEAACREMARVARSHCLVTANNCPSRLPSGEELHINRRPHEEWDRLFKLWFAPGQVRRIEGARNYPNSPCWRVDL